MRSRRKVASREIASGIGSAQGLGASREIASGIGSAQGLGAKKPREGIEPPTLALQVLRSATKLTRLDFRTGSHSVEGRRSSGVRSEEICKNLIQALR